MKIVVACDSMKGSLTSEEVCLAAKRGILSARPDAEVFTLPVADGGEGTAEILTRALGGEMHDCTASDALGRPMCCKYGIVRDLDGKTIAIMDAASTIGLTHIAENERDVAIATSRGLGEMILQAYETGCRRFLLGLGGSATNDGGRGMLEALGVRFLDAHGAPIAEGSVALKSLADIDISEARMDILRCEFTVLCDVDNPLTGERGASRVFGPQKGADSQMVEALDCALDNYATVVADFVGHDYAGDPGAGAAGGLGFAFMAFAAAKLHPGIDTVLNIMWFDELVKDADLVITGEGRIDRQTLSGKVPMGVLRRCRGICPVVAIAGAVADEDALAEAGFAGIYAVSDPAMPLSQAMERATAMRNVERKVREVCGRYVAMPRGELDAPLP